MNTSNIQEENKPPTEVNESVYWCKDKMTASLSKETQSVIMEIAPSNVGNITQFIKWILEKYHDLTAENSSLQENQDDLNKKILDRDRNIEALEKELAQVLLKNTAPAPVPAPTPKKEIDFMTLLGF